MAVLAEYAQSRMSPAAGSTAASGFHMAFLLVFLAAALPVFAQNAATLHDDGLRAWQDGRLADAKGLLAEAVERAPQQTSYRITLARLLLETGDADRAVEVLTADRTAEDDIELLRVLAQGYLQIDRLAEARQCYRRITRLDGKTATDCYALGTIYIAEGKYALAVEALDAARNLGLGDADLHTALATAHFHLNHDLGVLRLIRVPGGQVGAIVGDVLLIEAHDVDNETFLAASAGSAIYHLVSAVAAGNDSLELRTMLGRCWLRGGRFDRACETFAALATEMEHTAISAAQRADYYASYADALYGADDMDGYLAKLGQAVELDMARYRPMLAGAYEQVAQRYNQRGDLSQYIHYLQQAVAESPKSADLHYRLGNGYWEAGDREACARQWLITLQIEPDHRDRRRMLEWIQIVGAERR